jgi:hypothetical protein
MAEAGVEEREQGQQQGHLQQGLKRRHMTMISLGVILAAYMLRRFFGPPERSPSEIIREHEEAAS